MASALATQVSTTCSGATANSSGIPGASANGHRSEPPGPNGSGPEQPTDGVRVSMPDEDERG